jgi:hypothetical protein
VEISDGAIIKRNYELCVKVVNKPNIQNPRLDRRFELVTLILEQPKAILTLDRAGTVVQLQQVPVEQMEWVPGVHFAFPSKVTLSKPTHELSNRWPLLLDALFDHDPMFSFETSYASSAKLNLYDLL